MGTFLKADKHKRISKTGKIGKMPCKHGNQDQRVARWLVPTIHFLSGVGNTHL